MGMPCALDINGVVVRSADAEDDVPARLELLAIFLESENEMLSLQKDINVKVRKRMEQNQKEYFLLFVRLIEAERMDNCEF